MSVPRIEPAAGEQLPAISALAAVIWRAHYPGILPPEQIDYMLARMYALETMREEIRSRGVRYDCLFAGDEMVGFAAYGPMDPPDTYKLHKLYLLPAHHGRGLGSLLLKHCEREARQLGAQRLILTVNKRNTKAIAAYQRNGFVIIQSVTVDIGGGYVMDDYIMTRELSP